VAAERKDEGGEDDEVSQPPHGSSYDATETAGQENSPGGQELEEAERGGEKI
jgi:hypothetical protein